MDCGTAIRTLVLHNKFHYLNVAEGQGRVQKVKRLGCISAASAFTSADDNSELDSDGSASEEDQYLAVSPSQDVGA